MLTVKHGKPEESRQKYDFKHKSCTQVCCTFNILFKINSRNSVSTGYLQRCSMKSITMLSANLSLSKNQHAKL